MAEITGGASARLYMGLSWLAKMLLAPLVTHWFVVGVAIVLKLPTADMIDITGVALGFVVIAALVVLTVYRSHPSVVERLDHGPSPSLSKSVLILTLGALSTLGGMALMRAGETDAGIWAIGLGTAVAMCEITSLAGGAFLDSFKSLDDE